MSIQLNAISKTFVTHSLFEGLTLQIGAKSRIGLIGRNGCGKSTLLKIIMDQIQPDGGSIYRAPGLLINYLSQEPRITPSLTLEAEMRSVFQEVSDLTAKEAKLLEKLSDESCSQEELMDLVNRLGTVQSALERLDAQSMDARIGSILKGLGFSLEDHQRKTGEFSGGWQMRINLAKVLLEGADILLLDEPTNHLDLEACEWMENYLKNYPGGLVLVSHDRRFMDQVATEIAELESGSMKVWTGNYTSHLAQKEAEADALLSAYDRQQKTLAKQTAFVDRFRASATRSTQAKSREKQLAKIERIELPDHDNRRMSIRFPSPQPSGKQVLTLRNVAKSFGNKALFSKIDADLTRQQRVFLLGANGAGKTTLLRLILGLETQDSGDITLGHNVQTGYFSQNQLETLDPALSIFDTMREACPKMTNTELRTLLGRFLFTGDQVFKPVSVLSGGEKSKLALAKLITSGPNTLILDEPTNHMDIPAKEVITEALDDYEGSMLCISHDRYFIQQLATDIWEIYNGHLLNYGGDYDYYLLRREAMHAQVDANNAKVAPGSPKAESAIVLPVTEKQVHAQSSKELEKQLKKLEKKLTQLEEEIAALEVQLHDPNLQQDYQQLHVISSDIEQKQKMHAQLDEQWNALAGNLSL